VLEFTATDHVVDHLLDGGLRVLLLDEVLDDRVLRHLGSDGEPALQLLLDPVEELLILLSGKALGAGETSGRGSLQG